MSNISIKTTKEIEIMRHGGKILAEMLNVLKDMIKPGIDVWELEEKFIDMCNQKNVIAGCKGYAPGGLPPFPTGLCISLNDQSVHCFPKKGTILKEGDLINVDTVIKYKDYFVDSSFAKGVGNIPANKKRLLEISEKALYLAIDKIKDNTKMGELSFQMQKITDDEGFSVLQDYAGHGIGKEMHEAPEIPCFGFEWHGPIIKSGMTLAIETLFCEKGSRIKHTSAWCTKTADGGIFAQFEHTVLVTKKGYEILTKI